MTPYIPPMQKHLAMLESLGEMGNRSDASARADQSGQLAALERLYGISQQQEMAPTIAQHAQLVNQMLQQNIGTQGEEEADRHIAAGDTHSLSHLANESAGMRNDMLPKQLNDEDDMRDLQKQSLLKAAQEHAIRMRYLEPGLQNQEESQQLALQQERMKTDQLPTQLRDVNLQHAAGFMKDLFPQGQGMPDWALEGLKVDSTDPVNDTMASVASHFHNAKVAQRQQVMADWTQHPETFPGNPTKTSALVDAMGPDMAQELLKQQSLTPPPGGGVPDFILNLLKGTGKQLTPPAGAPAYATPTNLF